MKEISDRGMRIPEDITITGFDNLPESEYTIPPLTTIMQPVYMQGVKALETIVDLIDGKDVPGTIYLDTRVHYRNTCGCISFETLNHVIPSLNCPEIEIKNKTELLEQINIRLNQFNIVGPRYDLCYSLVKRLWMSLKIMRMKKKIWS